MPFGRLTSFFVLFLIVGMLRAPLPSVAQEGQETAEEVTETPAPPPPAAAGEVTAPVDSGMEPVPSTEEGAEENLYNTILLQGLNKVTARISSLKAPIGTVVRFGNLEIIARACWQSPPEARPENAALMEVWELKPGEQPARIFAGWMFSSSPALSALEHPVYDLTVIRCEKGRNPSVSE